MKLTEHHIRFFNLLYLFAHAGLTPCQVNVAHQFFSGSSVAKIARHEESSNQNISSLLRRAFRKIQNTKIGEELKISLRRKNYGLIGKGAGQRKMPIALDF